MGHVSAFFSAIVKAIPVLLAKVGTVLLFIFTAGLFVGYFLAVQGYSWKLLLIPIIAMLAMWYKLDEGIFVLLLLIAVAYFFPEVFLF